MKSLLITPIEDSLWQGISVNLQIGDETKRVTIDLIYMDKTDQWYMSVSDLQTKAQYMNMVPLLSSKREQMNNLWLPFAYKGIGQFYCIPKTDSPSTENPSKDNLNEFYLIWSDGLE